MLRVFRQTDYAARVLLHLASLGEGATLTIAEISEQKRMPIPFVRRVVAGLAAVGILKTARGKKGGVQLGRPAAEISFRDIVVALEGPIALNACVLRPEDCVFGSECRAHLAWMEASEALSRQLDSIKISALLSASAAIPG
jgi:Rrf2 family protein